MEVTESNEYKQIAIMQPYIFPYLGYFQLINAVDIFVIYDNIQFSKKGWFHRNRLLFNKRIEYFTLNIAKDSDFLDVADRKISTLFFERDMPKLLRKIELSYRDAPQFEETFDLIRNIMYYKNENLFEFIFNSLVKTCEFLQIKTRFIKSSDIPVDHSLKNKYRIFEICKYLKGNNYINPPGGQEIYSKEDFRQNNVNLRFLLPSLPNYPQFSKNFIEGLSIIDLMMHNSKASISSMLNDYELK